MHIMIVFQFFFSGQINTYEYEQISNLRQHSFQESDIVKMVQPITKYAVKIENPDDIQYELSKAYHIAIDGRPGPVLIDLPMNIQRADIKFNIDYIHFNQSIKPTIKIENALNYLYEQIDSSNAPIILIGNGFNKYDLKLKEKILEISKTLSIPIVTTLLAKDVVDDNFNLKLGILGAAYGSRTANFVVNSKTDLIISFWCKFYAKDKQVLM